MIRTLSRKRPSSSIFGPSGSAFAIEELIADRSKRLVLRRSRRRRSKRRGRGKSGGAGCLIQLKENPRADCEPTPTAESKIVQGTEWLSNDDIDKSLDYLTRQKGMEHVHHVEFATVDFTDFVKDKSNRKKQGDINYQAVKLYEEALAGKLPDKEVVIMPMNIDVEEGPGFHWTANFIFLDRKNKFANSFYYYFDSAKSNMRAKKQSSRKDPPAAQKDEHIPLSVISLHDAMKEAMKKATGAEVEFPLYVNKLEHQKGASECGVYVLFVLYFMSFPLNEPISFPLYCEDCGELKPEEKTFSTYDQKREFLDRHKTTDEAVSKYRQEFFHV